MRTKAWKIDMEGKKPLKTLCPQALMALQTCLIHIIFGETQDQLCCHLQTGAGSDCSSSKLVPYLQCQLSHPAAPALPECYVRQQNMAIACPVWTRHG